MEKLITPDFGLMFWTVLNFLILVLVLGKFAWKPVMAALDEREKHLKTEREAAETARAEAEKFRDEINARLKEIGAQAARQIAEAERLGEQNKAAIIKDAKTEAESLLARAKIELEQEKNLLVAQIRSEVATLSLSAAEKLLQKEADKNVHKKIVDDMFAQLAGEKK